MTFPRLFRRGVRVATIAAIAGLIFPAAAAAQTADSESVVEAMDALALQENQSIRAFDARIRQSREEAEYEETQWPDPMVEYMFDVTAPWAPHSSTGHMVRVMQAIPLPGSRDALAAPARAEEEVSRSKQVEASVDLLRNLRQDAVELARIEAQLELIEDEIGLIDDALGVAEAVVPFGEGDHGDFFQLELARETAIDKRASLRSARDSRRARMASRIGVETERVAAMDFEAELLESWLIELPAEEEIVEIAREREPSLAIFEAEGAVAEARMEQVHKHRIMHWPTLMAGYSNSPPMWDIDGPRNQMIQLGVSFSIPVFGAKYHQQASQWEAAVEATDLDREQRSSDVRGAVEDLMTGWETDQERLERHTRELAPLAGDLAEQVLIGMELGERSAAEFLLALRQELEIQERIIELRADLLNRLMELQRLTGGEIGADQAWAYPTTYGGEQ